MNSAQIIARALRKAHTNAVDYPSVVEDLNLVYQDIVDRIVVITKGDFFWDKGTTDTVVNQSEYVAEKLGIAPDDLDIKKINKVFIKYKTGDDFKRVRYQDPASLNEHPDYYKEKQSENDPFFYIQDTSIFLFPAPQEAVTGGLELFVIHKPADLTELSSESDIEVPSQFHDVIATGIARNIFESQLKLNEAQLLESQYEARILEMVNFMKQRYNQPIEKTITGLEAYY